MSKFYHPHVACKLSKHVQGLLVSKLVTLVTPLDAAMCSWSRADGNGATQVGKQGRQSLQNVLNDSSLDEVMVTRHAHLQSF